MSSQQQPCQYLLKTQRARVAEQLRACPLCASPANLMMQGPAGQLAQL